MKLAEIQEGTTVFHPIFGEGAVIDIDDLPPEDEVEVKFGDVYEYFHIEENRRGHNISHLYPHPVTVIATEKVERLKDLVKAQDELIKAMNSRTTNHWVLLGNLRAKINQLKNQEK